MNKYILFIDIFHFRCKKCCVITFFPCKKCYSTTLFHCNFCDFSYNEHKEGENNV